MRSALLELHLANLLLSMTLLFTRLIDWPVPVLIAFRCVLGAFGLWFFIRFWPFHASVSVEEHSAGGRSGRAFWVPAISGALLAGHWMTFFYAGRISTIALAMVAMYTYPLMTAMIEPFLEGRPNFRRMTGDVLLAMLATAGIFIIGYSAVGMSREGLLWGLLSAALLTARNLLIRRKLQMVNGSSIMLVQLMVAGALLLPSFLIFSFDPAPGKLVLAVILALVFTAFSHTLLVRAILKMSARTASVIASVQPVYSAIFAYLLLGEKPEVATVLGGSLVILSALLESLRQKKREERSA